MFWISKILGLDLGAWTLIIDLPVTLFFGAWILADKNKD